jgi:signal transduction histidine kinase
MKFPFNRSAPRTFSYPFYLFAVITVLITILLINSSFEIQRTRSQLFNILESEGLLIIKGLEKNSANLISVLSSDGSQNREQGVMEGYLETLGIEDLLIERLVNLAIQLDQSGKGAAPDSTTPGKQVSGWEPKRIFFLKPDQRDPSWAAVPEGLKKRVPFYEKVLKGKNRLAVLRGSGTSDPSTALSVAVARRVEPGMILLVLSREEYLTFGRQIVIQGFLEEYAGKGNIAYIEVTGADGRRIAQAGEAVIEKPASAVWKKEVRSGDPRLIWIKGEKNEFLEMDHAFSPAGQKIGQLRLGLSLKEVAPILNQSRRSMVLMGLVLLGLGVSSLFFIFRLQGRHIQRMRELEEEIRKKEELSAMGQLAAGVAHEIKNPLNAIGLVVQRLAKEFIPQNPEEQEEYKKFTGMVRSEIDRVNHIIGQFLMISKPLNTRMEAQALADILDYVLEVLGEEIRQKDIRIQRQWPNNLPPIQGDRFQLTQAFLNILQNALEAMDPGGEIEISVALMPRSRLADRSGKKIPAKLKIKEGLKNRDLLLIFIKDTGRGMSPEVLENIFAPYYTTKEKGVGLGLAITQKIVQGHGGDLVIHSSEKQGTRVEVLLPL